MYGEHLQKAGFKTDLIGSKKEDAQHRGQCGNRDTKLCEGQHSQEQVHRLVKRAVFFDHCQDQAIAHKSHKICGAEWEDKPRIQGLQTRKTSQQKIFWDALTGVEHFLCLEPGDFDPGRCQGCKLG